MQWRDFISGVLLAGLALPFDGRPAAADDRSRLPRDARAASKSQHDEALEAVKRGEIRLLAEAQAVAETAMPGQVVAVEIERRKGRLVYEFKIVVRGGRVREVYVDAASLAVVKVE